MTAEQAALILECKVGLVYKLCAEGLLGFSRVGIKRGKIVISEDDLNIYRKKIKVEPTAIPGGDATPTVRPKRLESSGYIDEWKRKKALKRKQRASS